MLYEEALSIGRNLTAVQRCMLFDTCSWKSETVTPFNRDELLWKQLIKPSTGGRGFVRTERGEDIMTVAMLKTVPDVELFTAWRDGDGASRFATHVCREIEDRNLDL